MKDFSKIYEQIIWSLFGFKLILSWNECIE